MTRTRTRNTSKPGGVVVGMYVARCRDDGVEDLGCCFFVLFVAPAGMCVCVCSFRVVCVEMQNCGLDVVVDEGEREYG